MLHLRQTVLEVHLTHLAGQLAQALVVES
jgi:hypothetical protein